MTPAMKLCIIFFAGLSLLFTTTDASCSATDQAALLALKTELTKLSTTNSVTTVLKTWDATATPDCCTWSGVACSTLANTTTIAVTSLDLSSCDLTGALSDDTFEAIAGLTSLQNLSLASNSFSGSIPSNTTWATALAPSLQVFSLAKNYNITGSIPDSVSLLTSLTSLDLSYNQFYGLLPVSLLQVHNLTYLNVSNNQLSGQIPQQSPYTDFPASAYSGNSGLCGTPLDACVSY